MPHIAKAWFLYPAGEADERGQLAQLALETLELPDPGPDEVLAEPLFGSWEGNMHHALLRKPVDVCVMRKEPRVVVGNAGVVRVLEVGEAVTNLRHGQLAMMFSAGEIDRFGYMTRAAAYDAPGTMGCLATRMITRARCLVPLPEVTRHELAQWAAFSIRHVTAWSNWRLAYGTFRLQIGEDELPSPNVWGWSGGTTLAELELAKRHGCTCAMLSATPEHLAHIERAGITAVDRRPFAAVSSDPGSYADAEAYEAAYAEAEALFLEQVRRHTDGLGVQIFLDYIGTPTLQATLKALGREGVLATAGWKGGMATRFRRAVECIKRHQHIHTHYARYGEAVAAIDYGEEQGWMPVVDEPITPFDEIPTLARRYAEGDVGLFPVFAINPV